MTWGRGDWMQTFTGRQFWPLDPKAEDIAVEDIAHGLSLLCRYNGHISRFYSVAEHCVLMSQWVEFQSHSRLAALEALLHDGSEAYLGDMIRPLKINMPEYRAAEAAVELEIARKFGFPTVWQQTRRGLFGIGRRETEVYVMPGIVKQADNRILFTERAALMGEPPAMWAFDDLEPLPVTITGWSPPVAEAEWLSRLEYLS
jgi:uncharacterized protein